MFLVLVAPAVSAQDSLLDLLGEEEETKEYSTASFKTTRVINGHSLENTSHGVLDFRIGHRFGFLSEGVEEMFGLDQATIRLGFDYGVTDRLAVGFGRSSFQKTIDGFAKYKLLRQCHSGCSMPITLSLFAGTSITTLTKEKLPWYAEEREDYFTHRMAYAFQVIVGRKFSEGFSLQLMPGLVHRNLVRTDEEENDVLNVGAGGRVKLTKRVTLNAEYFYVLPGQLRAAIVPEDRLDDPNPGFKNSLSVGLDIETGGHVFQVHLTNSTAMYERGFITETTGDWLDGEIHIGFNISRVFTLHRPKQPQPPGSKEEGW
ncbi:MAG: hypothetical protein KDB88_11830 [Flavobacteriales bacterium]|nr:hypothetical protein [Flavobacteriales bacterium]